MLHYCYYILLLLISLKVIEALNTHLLLNRPWD